MDKKRQILISMMLVLIMVLVACGGDDGTNDSNDNANEPAPAATDAPVTDSDDSSSDDAATDSDAMEATEIRFSYYADGNEADVMQAIIDRFEAANPDISVVLDVVPYATIDEQLPIQVETGDGPDLARITNFAAFRGNLLDMRPYMNDPGYFESNFPAPVLAALRDGGGNGLHGYPDGLTVTGPYVNKTLFDQMGMDVPGEGTTWEEWTELTREVAEGTGVQYAISIDRTGHRFAGPAMSMGATLIDENGHFTVDTPGFRAFAEILNGWHEAAITPSEVWLVGDSINSCIDAFKSGELVMCMSGSWQINGLAADIGDDFDWVVVPNPTGPGGSTGVAGGSAVVAFADTQSPEAVAKLVEFLIQAENYGEFSAGTLILPAQTDVASSGVEFETDNASVLGALSGFTAEIPKLQDQAVGLNVHPFAFAYYRNSANRIGQYLTGELSLDDMLDRLQQDIDDAITEAGGMPAVAEETAPAEEMNLEGEIRFAIYADGSEAEAMQSLIDKFMAQHPGASVILDVVPYQTIDEQLPIQVETGDGPDIARITGFPLYRGKYLDLRPYLSDPDYFESNFNSIILDAFREEGDDTGLYGFPDSFTVTGPYVNKTLFDQAGIAMPGPGASWEDWTEATKQVAEATETQFAISVDRTGYRIAGPAMSMGATLFDADDNFTVDSPGFRAYIELINGWHDEGITPSEVWLVGDSINSCIDFFKSGDLVMCMSGSWQIGGLAADVGDDFDWVVVPNPAGPGGSTGVPGGAGIAAFADTEYPELVAAFMEFVIQEENYHDYSAQTLLLPGHIGVASNPVAFETDNESVLNALNSYTAEVPKLQDQGFTMTYHPFAFAYFRNSANRIGQYLTGELSLDDALGRLQQDIDDAISEAGG